MLTRHPCRLVLLQGSAYRNLGKPSQAAHHLARAEELVDAELAERQFNLQVGDALAARGA